jgi:hypothetical protein
VSTHILKSGHKEFFEYWQEYDIVSIGWKAVAEAVVNGASREEIKSIIRDKYPESDPASAAGHLIRFVGRESKTNNIDPGDTVIVVGSDNVRGRGVIRAVVEVGEVGEVNVADKKFHPDFPHLLYRDVRTWRYDDGPVARNALSEKFHQGGDYSTHTGGTLKEWKHGQQQVAELVEELENKATIKPKQYDFEFDEKVVQAHIRDHVDEFQRDAKIVSDEFEKEYYTEDGKFADFVFFSEGEVITVVELKRGLSPRSAVTQLRNYMDVISENRDEPVRGLLIAEEFDNPEEFRDSIGEYDISLMRYSVTLDYDEVPV